MFLIKKRRLADVQHWTVALSNSKSSLWRFSVKMLFLKILQYSRENTCVKFLRRPVLKNIYGCLLLNWFYEVTVLNFVSGSHLKPSRLNNITSCFQTRVLTKFYVYIIYIYLTPTLSYKPKFYMFITGYCTKSKCLDSLLKDVIIYCCVLFD